MPEIETEEVKRLEAYHGLKYCPDCCHFVRDMEKHKKTMEHKRRANKGKGIKRSGGWRQNLFRRQP